MHKFFIFYFFILTSLVYADTLEFKSFNSYQKAIKYISDNKDFIQEQQKPQDKEKIYPTKNQMQNQMQKPVQELAMKPQKKQYQNIAPKTKSNTFNTSCKTPRLFVREYYTQDTNLYSFKNGSSIRYKYSPSEIDKEFFIILKNFSYTDITDIILSDKKRFLIKTKLTNKTIHKKLTNIDGAKRLELGVVKNRQYPMYIVLQSYNDMSIAKCDVFLQKRGSSSLVAYKSYLIESNNYDIVYKIYLDN